MAAPCFCTMEITEDYVVVTQQDKLESTTTASANGQSNLVLRSNDCHASIQRVFSASSGGDPASDPWIQYPTDIPEKSDQADWANKIIYLPLKECIKQVWQLQGPKTKDLSLGDLSAYKYDDLKTDNMYMGFLFLRMLFSDKSYLYARVGITKKNSSDLIAVVTTEAEVYPNDQSSFVLKTIHQSSFVLRTNDCCTECGWSDFPKNGDDHSDRAHNIFLNIHEKIKVNRAVLPPPTPRVAMLDLTGYKYQAASTSDDQFHSFYFLRMHAGDNFYLYVKVGVMKDEHTPAKLLRLSSKIDRVTSE